MGFSVPIFLGTGEEKFPWKGTLGFLVRKNEIKREQTHDKRNLLRKREDGNLYESGGRIFFTKKQLWFENEINFQPI